MSIKDTRPVNKASQLLKEQIELLKNTEDQKDLHIRQNIIINYAVRIYGNTSREAMMVANASTKEEIIEFLKSFIDDLKSLGLPYNSSFSGSKNEINVNTSNNNHLTQTQNVEVDIILETIMDEIPPARIREIEEIVKSEEPKENKLKKIGEKLKDTGIEVVASTLAKVIGQSMGLQ